MAAILRAAGLPLIAADGAAPTIPQPRCWLADGRVIFSTRLGDSENVWELTVSLSNGLAVGAPRRVTLGGGVDLRASCSREGAIAFARADVRSDVWWLPFDTASGMRIGQPTRLTNHAAWQDTPALSSDGQFLAFTSDRDGHRRIRFRDLHSGHETTPVASDAEQRYPILSPSGTRVAFSSYEKDGRAVYVVHPGSAPERVCDGCLRVTDWASNDVTLLSFAGNPYRIERVDLNTRRTTPLVQHPTYAVLYGRYSPDQRWISFTVRNGANRARIFVGHVNEGAPVREPDWIPVADVGPDDYAQWSPDGTTIYFTSSRDGYTCLWARRIDPATKRPFGDELPVEHFHGELRFKHGGWSLGSEGIALSLVARKANVWMRPAAAAKAKIRS